MRNFDELEQLRLQMIKDDPDFAEMYEAAGHDLMNILPRVEALAYDVKQPLGQRLHDLEQIAAFAELYRSKLIRGEHV